MSQDLRLQGSLASRGFPELVEDLHSRRWTGTVTLTHAGIGKSIKVQDGRLVFASSSSPDDRLGELLLRRGRVTLRQLVDAGKAVVPGKRLGAILVEQGVLGPKDLIQGVVEHTQEIIYGVFQWTEGQYRLVEGEAGGEDITLRISTPDLILEGIRRIEAWSRVKRGSGGIAAQYRRADDYEAIVAQMNLSTEELGLVTALHEPQSVEGICAESPLGDFVVCQVLWALRVIGVVKRLDAQVAAGEAVPDDEGLGAVLGEERA
jgi:hypothetical protein